MATVIDPSSPIAMTGSQVTYTIPSTNTSGQQNWAVTFIPSGGPVTVQWPKSGAGTVVLQDGQPLGTSDPNDSGIQVGFTGAVGTTVGVILTQGIPS